MMYSTSLCVMSMLVFAQMVQSQTLSDHLSNTVAFSVGLTQTQHVSRSDKIVYNKLFTNMGGAYDTTSGDFTAPQNGLYVFHVHAYDSNRDKAMWIELFKNQDAQISVSGYNSHSSAGNSVILFLRRGDKVFVRGRPNQEFTLFGQPDEVYATFTGYLIQKLGGSNDAPAHPLVG